MSCASLRLREEFVADAVCLDAAEGRTYLRLQDKRGWVSERLRHDFGRFCVEPSDRTRFPTDMGFGGECDSEDEQPTAALGSRGPARRSLGARPHPPQQRARLGGRKKVIVVERAQEESTSAKEVVAGEAASQARVRQRSPSRPRVYRSDTQLWPEALGAPRPIRTSLRAKLRRLERHFGVQVRDSEADIKEAIDRADGFARACDSSKALRAHAEALRKEVAKVQKEWAKAVEKLLATEAAADGSGGGEGVAEAPGSVIDVLPVQVRGNRLYCASLRLRDVGAAEGATSAAERGRHLGPLRNNASEAAQDAQQMRARLGDVDGKASGKRPPPEAEADGEKEDKRRRLSSAKAIRGGG